jgi:hypothetical protein
MPGERKSPACEDAADIGASIGRLGQMSRIKKNKAVGAV